jgi:NodT family efflux transporter outer membrane factor (OMF) lipoprotein
MKLLIILLFLTSCNFAPKFSEPQIDHNKNWQHSSVNFKSSKLNDDWWNILGDKILNELVDEGIKNNYDVKVALANVQKSQLEKNISSSKLFPYLDYNLSTSKASSSNRINKGKSTAKYNSSSFGLSWEVDLFGRVRNNRKTAIYEHLSQIDQSKAVTLLIASQIIKNYIDLRSYQKLELATKENITLLDQTISLIKIKENYGIATNFDVARAISQKDIIEASLPNINATIHATIYKLSVLIGKDSTYLKNKLIKSKELPIITDPIEVGLPSQILKRRPDIKAAYNLMIANNAQIGSAIADFFPSISLTGISGVESTKFSTLFSAGSGVWQYGLDINLPIFRAGELISKYKITKENKKIAILNYEKTVLNAFMEVQSNLIKYAKEIKTREILKKAVKNNKKVVNLSEQRYKAGLDDFLVVIDVKRSLIEVESSLIRSEARVLINLANLFEALGGGIKNKKN